MKGAERKGERAAKGGALVRRAQGETIGAKEKTAYCYGPQKLDKEIITLFVNEFGTVPGSFRLE